MRGRGWMTGETRTLRELYPHTVNHKIGIRLGRTSQAVACMAKRLGLRKADSPPPRQVTGPVEACRLRDRIEELEGLLGLNIKLTNLELTRHQMKMAGLLLRKEIVSSEMFYDALYGGLPECDQPQPKTIDVHVCKLRKSLKSSGVTIKTRWGVGFYLEPCDRATLREMVAA